MSRTTMEKLEEMKRIREESRSLDAALRRFEEIMRRFIGRRVRVMDNWEGTIVRDVVPVRPCGDFGVRPDDPTQLGKFWQNEMEQSGCVIVNARFCEFID
jgi:hypothetical protein